MMHRVEHPPRTCIVCGYTFTRRANEKATNYTRRKTCGDPHCHATASNSFRTRAPLDPGTHKPCVICGGTVPARSGEKPFRYHRRTTCSEDCRRSLISLARQKLTPEEARSHEAARKRAWRANRQKIAPAGYKWNGRFPTPAGLKPDWTSVTGPALPPVAATRAPRSTPPADLPRALRAHPELLTALAGDLTDSWFPYSRSASTKGASTDA